MFENFSVDGQEITDFDLDRIREFSKGISD